MKSKILTAVSVVMLFVPWTILPLRVFDWALQSPVAEIMIYSYAAFMAFFGHLFHPRLYQRKSKIKAYAGMCRGQQHLRDRRHRDHLHDDSGMDQRVTGGDR